MPLIGTPLVSPWAERRVSCAGERRRSAQHDRRGRGRARGIKVVWFD